MLTQTLRAATPTARRVARARVGPQVMSKLFSKIAQVRGTEQTQGAFLGGLRIMAIDGTVMDGGR